MDSKQLIGLITAIAVLIAAGAFISIKFIKKKNSDNKIKSDNEKNITQSNNTVTNGDIVGGNKSVKN